MAQQHRHPILHHIERGDLQAVQERVRVDAVVLEEREDGKFRSTPLMAAIYCKKPAIAHWLLEHRGQHDLETANDAGSTALHYASYHGQLEVVEALVAAGANPAALAVCRRTPLMFASYYGHPDIVAFLLQLPAVKATIDAISQKQNTALSYASLFGHQPVFQLLLNAGADPTMPPGPDSPLNQALSNNHHAIAALLRRAIAERERARALQEEAEAAARRARNQKRRQKQKKAQARRRAAEGADAGGEDEAKGEEEEEKEELAAAMAGLSAGDAAAAAAAAGAEEVGAETAVGEQQPAAAAAPAAAKDPEEEEEAMLEAAIALSLFVDRPPPLKEYLEAEAPDGLLCPISMAPLDDPVVLVADGITYSRAAIEQHFAFCRERGKPLTSPSTNLEITDPADARWCPSSSCAGWCSSTRRPRSRRGRRRSGSGGMRGERGWQRKKEPIESGLIRWRRRIRIDRGEACVEGVCHILWREVRQQKATGKGRIAVL